MTRKKEINASQPATTRIATPLADLIDARLSRRSALKGLFAGGAAMVVAPVARAATQSVDPSSLGFAQAPHKIEMYHQAAPGHRADVLIRWGDKVRNTTGLRISSAGMAGKNKAFSFSAWP